MDTRYKLDISTKPKAEIHNNSRTYHQKIVK